MVERGGRNINRLQQQHQGETVLVVAHGASLNALICSLLRTPLSWLSAYRLEVGTVAEVLNYGAKATLVRLNDR